MSKAKYRIGVCPFSGMWSVWRRFSVEREDWGQVWDGPSWSSCCEALRIKLSGWTWDSITPSRDGKGAKVEGYP